MRIMEAVNEARKVMRASEVFGTPFEIVALFTGRAIVKAVAKRQG